MSPFPDFVRERRRLDILDLLAEAPGYSHNDAVLRSALAAVGHAVSADALRAELAWLAEQGLVEVSAVGEVRVARLRERGDDVAAGRAECPGVARPRPAG